MNPCFKVAFCVLNANLYLCFAKIHIWILLLLLFSGFLCVSYFVFCGYWNTDKCCQIANLLNANHDIKKQIRSSDINLDLLLFKMCILLFLHLICVCVSCFVFLQFVFRIFTCLSRIWVLLICVLLICVLKSEFWKTNLCFHQNAKGNTSYYRLHAICVCLSCFVFSQFVIRFFVCVFLICVLLLCVSLICVLSCLWFVFRENKLVFYQNTKRKIVTNIKTQRNPKNSKSSKTQIRVLAKYVFVGFPPPLCFGSKNSPVWCSCNKLHLDVASVQQYCHSPLWEYSFIISSVLAIAGSNASP